MLNEAQQPDGDPKDKQEKVKAQMGGKQGADASFDSLLDVQMQDESVDNPTNKKEGPEEQKSSDFKPKDEQASSLIRSQDQQPDKNADQAQEQALKQGMSAQGTEIVYQVSSLI